MKFSITLKVAVALACSPTITGTVLRAKRTSSDPDTACGKGFDNLVQGSQDWYATAAVKLFEHPYHTMDNATFETEFQCWFANMCTSKCDGLKSLYDDRNKELTAKCQSVETDWLKIWKMFTPEEVTYFKKAYPASAIDDETKPTISYKQAMETAKEINKKELLCLTLYTIDDECVKYKYIRLGK